MKKDKFKVFLSVWEIVLFQMVLLLSVTVQVSSHRAHSTSDVTMFDDDTLERLQFVFRFANVRNTAIGRILQHNIDMTSYVNKVESADDMLRKHLLTLADQTNGSATKPLQNVTSNTAESCRGSFKPTDHSYKPEAEVSSSSQVSGYEGCRRDYSALAEPITNSILSAGARQVLERVYSDVESQDDFCEISCNFLCQLVTISGCNLGCSRFCNRIEVTNTTTVDDVVTRIIQFVIPTIKAQPWARKSKLSRL